MSLLDQLEKNIQSMAELAEEIAARPEVKKMKDGLIQTGQASAKMAKDAWDSDQGHEIRDKALKSARHIQDRIIDLAGQPETQRIKEAVLQSVDQAKNGAKKILESAQTRDFIEKGKSYRRKAAESVFGNPDIIEGEYTEITIEDEE